MLNNIFNVSVGLISLAIIANTSENSIIKQ